ncbi:MAG: M28 family metallopeptidase, partial [Fimbriimonadaceae bacterium]
EYMDWKYLANVTRLNALALGQLSNAAMPPKNVRITNDQAHDTTLTWDSEPDQTYVVYWRDTASSVWQGSIEVKGKTTVLKK